MLAMPERALASRREVLSNLVGVIPALLYHGAADWDMPTHLDLTFGEDFANGSDLTFNTETGTGTPLPRLPTSASAKAEGLPWAAMSS